jgi:hypothetical protein
MKENILSHLRYSIITSYSTSGKNFSETKFFIHFKKEKEIRHYFTHCFCFCFRIHYKLKKKWTKVILQCLKGKHRIDLRKFVCKRWTNSSVVILAKCLWITQDQWLAFCFRKFLWYYTQNGDQKQLYWIFIIRNGWIY